MAPAATSGGLPLSCRAVKAVTIRWKESSYSARWAGSAWPISCVASLRILPTASVRMLPGSTTTTRMFQGASSWRSASARVVRALLDAARGPVNGGVNRVPIEPTITIRPCARRSSGRKAWVTASCPVTLTSSSRRKSPAAVSSSGLKPPMPALFTSPARPAAPTCPPMASASAAIWACSVTSSSSGVTSPGAAASRAACCNAAPSLVLRTPA